MDLLSCDMDLEKLSQKKVKPFTWLICEKQTKGLEVVYNFATGFAIDVDKEAMGIDANDVVLMSCAHHFMKKGRTEIKVRRSEDEGFIFKAEVHKTRRSWDIVILIVKGVDQSSISYGEFAVDGSIASCETLLHVCHSEQLIWSAFVGRAAYPCLNTFDSLDGFVTCENYHSSFEITPKYRSMGHAYNKEYFHSQPETSEFIFEKTLHPLIPIIQCAGFTSKVGCFGGPVVNLKGEIVGMMSTGRDRYKIAIHVSLLKKFVADLSIKAQGSSEVKEKGKHPLGLDSKRGVKRNAPF